jgi:hypothetical protein
MNFGTEHLAYYFVQQGTFLRQGILQDVPHGFVSDSRVLQVFGGSTLNDFKMSGAIQNSKY